MSAVVIGGGLAGRMAALALHARGVAVSLVDGGPGATALCCGSLDVAAASPGVAWLPWRDPLQGRPLTPRERLRLLLAEASAHPYAVLWGDDEELAAREIDAAVGALRGWLEPTGVSIEGDLDRSKVLPNLPGTVRIADFVISGPSGADVSEVDEVAWVDVPGLEAWDPAYAARTLAHELEALGLPVPRLTVERPAWPASLAAPRAGRIAPRLDQDEAQEALGKALAGRGAPGRLLLLPPILGVDRTEDCVRRVSQLAGGPVAEVLGYAPHATAGFRLQRALVAATAHVETHFARASAVGVGEAGFQVRFEDGSNLDAEVVVLATGRFVGRGLASDETIREPLLGLPLFDEEGRRVDGIPAHRSVRKGYGSPQPLYSAGVRVDTEMRPMTARGEVQNPRLFAAGDGVGGFDPARERTGMGVALATAWRAAECAAQQIGGTAS